MDKAQWDLYFKMAQQIYFESKERKAVFKRKKCFFCGKYIQIYRKKPIIHTNITRNPIKIELCSHKCKRDFSLYPSKSYALQSKKRTLRYKLLTEY